MFSVFFGDSLTSGEPDDVSYTKYIEGNSVNYGISGTTIGEYSIYPVDGYSLLEIYRRNAHIDIANRIFLEYGVNDTSSIMCGFATEESVVVSFVKALDGIRQRNSKAEIYFLALSKSDYIIKEYAKLQCEYLSNDYFGDFDFRFPPTVWAEHYTNIINAISKKLPVLSLIDDRDFFKKFLAKDNLHPTKEGHQQIGMLLNPKLKQIGMLLNLK